MRPFFIPGFMSLCNPCVTGFNQSSPMPQTSYCYHCGIYHPVEEMRQIMTKGGKRMRCIKSIEAAKRDRPSWLNRNQMAPYIAKDAR